MLTTAASALSRRRRASVGDEVDLFDLDGVFFDLCCQDDGRLLLLKPRMPVGPVGGASSHHAVPVALICSWLLLLHTAFGQKPARLPLIGRKPFIAAWNAPLDMCTARYNISTDVERLFHLQGSPRAQWTGQNLTIFYANRLGFYPHYTPRGDAVHGGLPQNCSLDLHLLKAERDIRRFIPAQDVRGLAVIDWEFWRPQWSRNWHKKDVYRRKSRELTARAYLNVTEAQVEELARRRFEKSAKAFMQKTLQLGSRLRPNTLWGFYLYPDCHNYNLEQQNYSGCCPLLERWRNDELQWLWDSSSALFPSVALRSSHSSSRSSRSFSRNRIRESLRVASLTRRQVQLPTFVYLRLGYRDQALAFLTAVRAGVPPGGGGKGWRLLPPSGGQQNCSCLLSAGGPGQHHRGERRPGGRRLRHLGGPEPHRVQGESTSCPPQSGLTHDQNQNHSWQI